MTVLNGNDMNTSSRPLTPGVYAPVPTFFLPGSQDLDIPTLQRHVLRMAQAKIGILLCGSMGEAPHLTLPERIQVISSSRAALDDAGFINTPIIAGTGVGSTRETISITKAAAEAGADYAIVIASGYFAGALAGNKAALKGFFREVAEQSPIPIMLYNYPGASGGIDLDSDLVEEMAMELPNLCGIKLTCGNVGKLTRICSVVSPPSFAEKYPRKNKDAPFLVLGGFVDFLLPSLYAGAHGAITGLANAYPYTLRALWEASLATLPSSSPSSVEGLQQAQHLQGIASHADRTIAVTGIPGTKWLLQKRYGYGGVCRGPLQPFADDDGEKLWKHKHVVDIEAVERELEKSSGKESALSIGKKSNVDINGARPVETNRVPVSQPSSSPSSLGSASTQPSSPASASEKRHPKRPSSIGSGVKSLIGSLRKKKTAA